MVEATPRLPETPDGATLMAERVNRTYANEPAVLLGSLLCCLVLAWVQGPVCGRLRAGIWCACLVTVIAARFLNGMRYRRSPVTPEGAGRAAMMLRSGVLASGIIWGTAALLFFPVGSPAHQVFTVFMLGGIVAGAAASHPAMEWAFPAFAVPVLGAAFLRSLFSGGVLNEAIALVVAIYAITISLVARSIRNSTNRAIRLDFENRGLVEGMKRSIRDTMSLNTALTAEIRERELAQDELRRHQELLEATVARRTGELSRANRDLRTALDEKTRLEEQLLLARKMESLTTLAGGVAHDFNNLLMGIGGQVSLLLAARAPGDPDADRLRAIERQVGEGAKLTRQLLGLSMGGKYEVRPLDPNALVRKVAALFARTHKEVRVTTHLETGLGALDADRGQLEHALLNICLNASQAMPGGGTVDLSTRRTSVDAARAEAYGARPGEFTIIAVADTGTGMDRSVLPRIFDPFFTTREPAGAAPRGEGGTGAGLGLSSAYGIVRNHGGFIEVDSERGRGSTFSLILPISASPPPPDEQELEREAEGGESAGAEARAMHTVLVVEDEPIVAEVASLMLQRLGLKVLKALGGEAALTLFRELGDSIDLVLLDMIMPGMGGEETFRRLRELRSDVRVLVSSGFSREGRAQELIQAGALGFLQKPYNLAELRAKLEEILGPLAPAHQGGEDAGRGAGPG